MRRPRRRAAALVLLLAAALGGPARASLLDSWIGPHEMRLLGGGTEIEYVGGIAGPAVAELARLLDANPRVAVLQLTSQGGDTLTAMGMEQLVRRHRLVTYVPRLCASACAYVFLGGRERYLARGARLGFHASFGLDDSPEAEAAQAGATRSWLVQRGIAPAFAERAVTTPSSTIWYPTAAEMVRAGVLTAAASPRRFAPPSFGSGTPRLLRGTSLRDDPLFAASRALLKAIRRADAAAFAAMQASVAEALRTGTYDPAIGGAVTERLAALLERAAAVGSDASVIAFTRARADEMERLAGIDPAVCVDLPAVTEAERDAADAAIPAEITLRQVQALTELLGSSVDRPQPPPSPAQAKAIYDALLRAKGRELGGDLRLLGRPELQPAAACRLRVAVMRAMLALDPGPRSVVLRAAVSGRL
ncbi:MAG: hypothetical protein U1E53_24395 [Dongiaceae bacterium]